MLERIGAGADHSPSFPFERMHGLHFARLALLEETDGDPLLEDEEHGGRFRRAS